jgi:hypothetical protein
MRRIELRPVARADDATTVMRAGAALDPFPHPTIQPRCQVQADGGNVPALGRVGAVFVPAVHARSWVA